MRSLRSMDRRLRADGEPNSISIPANVRRQGRHTKLFKCTMCNKEYLHQTSLYHHIRHIHRGGVPKYTRGRQQRWDSDQNNGDGVSGETRLFLYKCTYCVAIFNDEMLRNRHVSKMHSGRNIFDCLLCKSSFNKQVSLTWHKYVHHPNQKYPKVGRIASSASTSTPIKPSTSASVTSPQVKSPKSKRARRKIRKRTKTHTKTELPTERTKNGVEYAYANQFTCLYCPKTLSTTYAKEQHERRHTGNRPYACHFCELRFERVIQQEKHEQECSYLHEMVFCKYCDFHTVERANLESHYKRMHGFAFESEAEIEFLRREVLLEPADKFVHSAPERPMSPESERSDEEDGSKNESEILESTMTNEEMDENIPDRDLEPSASNESSNSFKRMSFDEFEQAFLNQSLELYSETSNVSPILEIVPRSTAVSMEESEETFPNRASEPRLESFNDESSRNEEPSNETSINEEFPNESSKNEEPFDDSSYDEIVSISKPTSNNETETDFPDGSSSLVPYSETSSDSSTAEIDEPEKSFQDRTLDLEPNLESSNELSKPIPSEEFEKAFREIISSEQNDRTEASISDQQSDHDSAETVSQVNDNLEKMFQDEISSPKVELRENTAASDVSSNDQLVAELEDHVSNQCLEDSPMRNLEPERNVDCPMSNLEPERNDEYPKSNNLIVERNIDSESIVKPPPCKTERKNPVDEKYIKYEIEVAQLDNNLREIFQSNEMTESSASAEDEFVEQSTPRRVIDLTEDDADAESSGDEVECTSGPVFLIDDD